MAFAPKLDVITRVWDSRIVEVRVGPEQHVYHVHAAALSASESPFLKALLSDRWDPNSDKAINWDHVDPETAERFLTYLYFGDFPVPAPEALTNVDTTGALSHKPRQNTLEDCLNSSTVTVPTFDTAGRFNSQAFPHSLYSYQRPILALARLYCLAEYHLCSALESIIIQRLSEILNSFDCSQPHAATEILETAEYVYGNTASGPDDNNSMCETLAQFAANNCSTLLHDDFEDLMLEGGDFALDIARKVHDQLRASQRQVHKI